MTVNLLDLLCHRIYPRPPPSSPSPKSQRTLLTRSLCEFPLILCFACSPLPAPALSLFWDFHSLAQTALALTLGHPMLSLSNYLTNRSETALISAYCSAWLIAASLGGLSGKLWYGGPNRPGRQTRENNSPVQLDLRDPQRHMQSVREPPPGAVQLVMALLNASLDLCSVHGGESYWIANSQRLDKKKKTVKDTSFKSAECAGCCNSFNMTCFDWPLL